MSLRAKACDLLLFILLSAGVAQGIVYGRPRAQVERNYLPRALQSEVDLTLDDDLALDLIAQRYLADAQPHPANQGAPVLETHLPGVNQYAMGRSSNALRYGAPLPRPASVIRCPPGGCNETFWAERNKVKRQAAPSPLPTTVPTQSQNFQQTCQSISWSFSGTSSILSARCYDQTGVLQPTSIGPDNCIGNKAGTMVCSLPLNYFWGTTCNTCSMSGTIMTCRCNRGNGVFQTTTLDVSQCFGNDNGVLYCTNHG